MTDNGLGRHSARWRSVEDERECQMKKLLLIALLAAFASATNTPIVAKVLGFGQTVAYANDDQGEDLSQDCDGECG